MAKKAEREKERPICPRCGKVGSGLYAKWVLNEQGKRYEPYYYFAHPYQSKGKNKLHWHYIRKKLALKILGSKKLMRKYRIEEVHELKDFRRPEQK